MTPNRNPQVLRLRKKHAPGGHERPQVEDGARLVRAQSLRNAVIAGFMVAVGFAAGWAMLSVALGRVFPWLTLLAGYLTGLVVRRAGRGLDWRFPTAAAIIAVAAAIVGNVVVAATNTALEYDTSVFAILWNVTTYTWPIFLDEVMTAADFIYAAFAAAIAAYFANRRLSRREYQALRLWQEHDEHG
ncbi:MAG: hypothetical protein R3288_12130 [Woeseiaceae bacterium]|nr:hypothetical protein [Woeseiaceae bacterium]